MLSVFKNLLKMKTCSKSHLKKNIKSKKLCIILRHAKVAIGRHCIIFTLFKAVHEYSLSLNLNYAFTKKFSRAWKIHKIDYA
jgi:hypothetical protein